MKVEVSVLIDRPVAAVFAFCAQDHVRNHPRWDPQMELEQESSGPIGVGTMIRRRASHSGSPVEGTMEVVEYEPDRAFGMLILEDGFETRGRMTFDDAGSGRTKFTLAVEIPGMENSMDPGPMTDSIKQTVEGIKKLIESES